MVHIVFSRSGDKLGMTAQGHAGYAEAGKDIVCAAASMLAYTLGQYVIGMQSEKKLAEQPTLIFMPGEFNVSFTPAEGYRQDGITAMRVIECGAACLEAKYPEFVRVHKVGSANTGD